jgi:hypothetical protein
LSNTLSVCSSLSVRDQVSHPYKTTGKTTVLYTLIFLFLDRSDLHPDVQTQLQASKIEVLGTAFGSKTPAVSIKNRNISVSCFLQRT